MAFSKPGSLALALLAGGVSSCSSGPASAPAVDGGEPGAEARPEAAPDLGDQPPAFAGIAAAVAIGETDVRLFWAEARDDLTPASGIVYQVFRAEAPGAQDFLAPPISSVPAATAATVGGLVAGVTYHFVVRAMDAPGNTDGNTVERSARTHMGTATLSGDVQPILTFRCSNGPCHGGATPARGLDLRDAARTLATAVGVASEECPTVQRIEPGSPATSYLMWKLQGGGPCFVGARMPRSSPPLDAADQSTIGTWIAAGALDD
jgi:hypothetical protein